MALTVWKFPLQFVPLQQVGMPAGSAIIKVAEQHGVLCLWAWCDPNSVFPQQNRQFAIVGTGQVAPSDGKHLDSVLVDDGEFVWHVFELQRGEPPPPPPDWYGTLNGRRP